MMNKQLLIILFLSMSNCVLALSIEGKSSYVSSEKLSEIEAKAPAQYLADLDTLDLSVETCEYNILEKINVASLERPLEDALIYLRSKDKIDDTQFRLLSKSADSFEVLRKSKFLAPLYKSSKGFEKGPFERFSKELERGTCLNQAYKKLVSGLGETKKNKIIGKFKVAYRKELISKRMYWQIKRLAQSEYHKEPKTLAEYLRIQNFLTKQFIERESIESSDYISKRRDKSKVSRREYFLAKFNEFQIVYLREMTQRLINRLNADEVTINVFIDGEVVEEILLDPLEQYRFAAKMVRKELGDLGNMNLFSGMNVSFDDILVAAFETALISGDSISSLEMVEDVWNPDLTKAEKRKMFIKRYGTIFAAAMPTSVYLVKVLTLVGIEMFTKTKEEPSRDHSMF